MRPIHEGLIRGYLHESANPLAALVLTHGAGSNCETLLLRSLADAFSSANILVLRCDLPFRQQRPTGPPRNSAAEDQAGLRAALAFLRTQGSTRVFAAGHSYGGRMASMLAASDPTVADGLLLLSYPLHPPKQREQLRTAHFPKLQTPALFVHGSRDGFGNHDELDTALQLIPAKTEIREIPSAGHELLSKKNAADLPPLIVQSFLTFFEI